MSEDVAQGSPCQERQEDKTDPGASRHGNFMNYYQFHPAEERVRQLPCGVWRSARPDRKYVDQDVGCNAGEKLYSWVLQRRLEGELITDNILTEKAEAMRNESGRKFKNWSQNWLWKFKSTYDLWHVFVLKLWQTQKEFKISDDNLYNVDETSLFWKMLPKELTGANEQGVIKNERIILALCSNATGSHDSQTWKN
ncbi:hypothetical protein K0M31_015837 [Melipona bicolor]|uniref:HTH CENPB-type domain-containing protein n=1 Tax=Melipona bicolor TaxID=60889 RepID=A0AA40KEX5_9HYME|nr:hypothetical protein K0M31_015837 [Melipona bicolor]